MVAGSAGRAKKSPFGPPVASCCVPPSELLVAVEPAGHLRIPVTFASRSEVAPGTTRSAGAPVEIEPCSADACIAMTPSAATLRIVLDDVRGALSQRSARNAFSKAPRYFCR